MSVLHKCPSYRGVLKREFIVIVITFRTAKQNCAELYKAGERISGVYTIDPDGQGAFEVFCDQTTTGAGWTVFQKRLDGSVDFYRGWADYKRGFGNLNGEFWLGLDKIHRLTKSNNRLRVDLEDTTGKTAYAEYDMFAVTSERSKYQLSLGTYSGERRRFPVLEKFYLMLNSSCPLFIVGIVLRLPLPPLWSFLVLITFWRFLQLRLIKTYITQFSMEHDQMCFTISQKD